MFLITISIALFLGLAILVVGVRGARIDDHPICRKCRFDLFGLDIAYATCPECGTPVTLDELRVGNVKRSPALIGVGVVLTVPGLLGLAILVASPRALVNKLPSDPLIWLATTSGDPTSVGELATRMTNNSLARGQADRLVQDALRRQTEHRSRWNVDWGNIVDEAILRDWLSASEVEAYLRQATAIDMFLPIRANSGSSVQPKFMFVGPIATPSDAALGSVSVRYRFDIQSATIDGRPWPLESHSLQDFWPGNRMRVIDANNSWEDTPDMDSPATWSSLAPLNAPPGTHQIVLTIAVSALHANDPQRRWFNWTQTFNQTLQVRASGESLITSITDPTKIRAVRDRIRLSVRQKGPSDRFQPELRVECEASDVAVCMRVEVWTSDTCWASRGLGIFEYPIASGVVLAQNREPIALVPPPNADKIPPPKTVRVRFIPDRREAADAGMLDIAGEPIEFVDVPVE